MATKTVCVHRYIVPPLSEFIRKYYFLVTSLFFEFQSGEYYRDDVEVYGFSDAEMQVMTNFLSNFCVEGKMLKVEDFDIYMVEELIAKLPDEWKKTLVDHMVLSSIDKADDIREAVDNLKEKMIITKSCLPLQEIQNNDFVNFFVGKDSSFMNEYYPTQEDKDELRLQYGIKR